MTITIGITGATGLVGRRIASALHARGDGVVVLTRRPEREHGIQAVATRRFDTSAGLEPGALEGLDGVVHLAGETVQGRWTARKKEAILESRRQGTKAVVDALRDAGEARPKVLVSASAIGWYGERGDDRLEESEPAGGDFLAGVCQTWEAEAQAAEALGVRVCQLRFGLVLAPEGGALGEMLTPFKLGLGGKLGSGEQWWSWVHIDDLVRLVLRCLDDEAFQGPLNVAAPEPVRQKDFAKTLASALGRPAFLPAPKFALKLALGEFSTELLTSKRVVPARAQALGFEFAHTQLAGALADLLA